MKLTLKQPFLMSGILLALLLATPAYAASDLLKADKPESVFFSDYSLLKPIKS